MALNWMIGAALGCAAVPLGAAPLTVRVTDLSGKPVGDAVVTLYPAVKTPPSGRMNAQYVISRQNLQFHPPPAPMPMTDY